MSADVAETLQRIESWSVADQLELANRIWDRLEAEGVPLQDQELEDELDRRLDDHATNPNDVTTWDEIVKYVRRQR